MAISIANPALSVVKKRAKWATLSRRKIKRVHTPYISITARYPLISDKEFGSGGPAANMCACRHRKSFLIEDILGDQRKPRRSPSKERCRTKAQPEEIKLHPDERVRIKWEIDPRVNIERRSSYPLQPTPIKAAVPWHYKPKSTPMEFSYYSEPLMDMNQILRSQLAATRLVHHPYGVRQTYAFDRGRKTNEQMVHLILSDPVAHAHIQPLKSCMCVVILGILGKIGLLNCCSGWWGVGGRRKGGQVRFSAAQTAALERRFGASKYLSPDERRALAASLRLSDRQVKTWFQNRRAKWRRSAPEGADGGSPSSAEEPSDDEITIADDD